MLKDARARRKFAKTRHPIEDGPACRIYGSIDVKKVTGNLHVVSGSWRYPLSTAYNPPQTTLGHGYLSWEHTDHACRHRYLGDCTKADLFAVMNLSHVITEFSFGPFFPRIIQPLDNTIEMATARM